jgi:hypothetical protein
MGSNIQSCDHIPVDAEEHPQVSFNHNRINGVFGAGTEAVNFVGSKRRMERSNLKDFPFLANQFFLPVRESVEIPPIFFDRLKLVTRALGGGSLCAVSIETNRPWLKSSRARMKDSGTASKNS